MKLHSSILFLLFISIVYYLFDIVTGFVFVASVTLTLAYFIISMHPENYDTECTISGMKSVLLKVKISYKVSLLLVLLALTLEIFYTKTKNTLFFELDLLMTGTWFFLSLPFKNILTEKSLNTNIDKEKKKPQIIVSQSYFEDF